MLNSIFLLFCHLIFGFMPISGDIMNADLPAIGNPISTNTDASDIALTYLGKDCISNANLDRDFKNIPILITINNVNTEFARREINGRRAWRVAIDSVRFEIKNNRPINESERYKFKDAELLLDSITGNLLEATLLCANSEDYKKTKFEHMIPYIFDRDSSFHGFPSIWPKVGLVEAIEKCEYYPGIAKEIKCSYVMYSHNGKNPHPTWIITMLGLPQRSTPAGLVYNNMKCFIDAIDGHGYPVINYTLRPEKSDSAIGK